MALPLAGAALERWILGELPSIASVYRGAVARVGRRGAYFATLSRLMGGPYNLRRAAAASAATFARRAVQAGEILIGGGSAEDAMLRAPESSYLFGSRPGGNRVLYTAVVRFPGAAGGADAFRTIECASAAGQSLEELLGCVIEEIAEDMPEYLEDFAGVSPELVAVSTVVRRY